MVNQYDLDRAAELILMADSLLITAGAGIGIDSGLPDFRSDNGFWNAYPGLGNAKIEFMDIANHAAFAATPNLAWGFYGHRLKLYRHTVPHLGFQILRELGRRMAHGVFVYTSNVDGQFQKAGFDCQQIVECHGSIHHLQCLAACSSDIWSADGLEVDVDESTCMLTSELPRCPHCGRLSRPNILLFEDWSYLPGRTNMQQARLTEWLRNANRLVVVELGAGTSIPSARRKGESLQVPLIRINPTEFSVSGSHSVGLQIGALDGLRLLKARLDARG